MPADVLEGHGGLPKPVSKKSIGLVALVGAATPLAFAPFSYVWLMPLLLAVLMWQQYGRSPAGAFKLALAFGSTGFATGLYWIYISTHVYTGAPAALSVFLIALLALYLSLYGATAGALAAWLAKRAAAPTSFYVWLLAYVCAWPLLELLRNYVLTGFPWLALGYTQSDTWLNGWAPISGVFGLAVPLLLLAALPLALKQGKFLPIAALSVLFLALGYVGQQQAWTTSSGETLTVGIAQGNIEQDQKWLPENRWPTVRRYAELTETLLPKADLIVWPEVAIPGAYREFRLSLFRPLTQQLQDNNAHLLGGVMRWDDATQQYANAVVQLTPQGPQFYDKQHLVPFAEYFPVPSFVRAWLKALELPFTDLYTGDDNRKPFNVAGQIIATSICFEDVFAEEVALAAADANILVNVSNDAWFGRSIAAAQHEQIARMRSMETRRWMVRATPTGYSAFIDPFGRVAKRLPRGEIATAIAEVEPLQGQTPYMMVRNLWMAGLLLILLVLLGVKLNAQRQQAFYD